MDIWPYKRFLGMYIILVYFHLPRIDARQDEAFSRVKLAILYISELNTDIQLSFLDTPITSCGVKPGVVSPRFHSL